MSKQQEHILRTQYRSVSGINRANEYLDNKKIIMLVIIGLISVWQLQHNLFAFIPLILSIVLSIRPDDYIIPGTCNWDELYQKYIYVDDDKCLDQIIDDHFETIDKLLAVNKSKAKSIYLLFVLIAVQILMSIVYLL